MAKKPDVSLPKSHNDDASAPDAIDGWIGSRIKIRRLHVGVATKAMADHLGLTRQAVERIEAGTTRCPAGRLGHIAQLLDINPGWFYEGCPTIQMPNNSAPALAAIATPDGLDLLDNYNRLLPEQRRALRLFADACSKANAAEAAEAAMQGPLGQPEEP